MFGRHSLLQAFGLVLIGYLAGCASELAPGERQDADGAPQLAKQALSQERGPATADLSGYIFRDNDDTHAAVIPAGTLIPPGGYLVLEELTAFTFGLGSGDSARLFAPDGTTVVDSFTWTAHATTTYGRCPNGTGGFVTTATTSGTKGTTNACP